MAITIALILAAFFQAAFLPFDLVLLILISKSFAAGEKGDYWLAFVLGLFVSLLSVYTLGSLSIFYLVVIKIVHTVKKTHFASNWLVVLPLTFCLVLLTQLGKGLILGSKINLFIILLQSILAVPIYLAVRFWEERFIPQPQVRLKIRG